MAATEHVEAIGSMLLWCKREVRADLDRLAILCKSFKRAAKTAEFYIGAHHAVRGICCLAIASTEKSWAETEAHLAGGHC